MTATLPTVHGASHAALVYGTLVGCDLNADAAALTEEMVRAHVIRPDHINAAVLRVELHDAGDGGDDPSGFEQNMANFMPKWTAYEMRLMAERYVSDGMIPEDGDVERLTSILGRPLHSYRDFASACREARSPI